MTWRKARPQADRQEWLANPKRVVVKVGSGVLSRGGIGLHRPTTGGLASALASLRSRGIEVILVS